MINKPSFSLLCWTIMASVSYAQNGAYTSAFSAGQQVAQPPVYMMNGAAPSPGQGPYMMVSGHTGVPQAPAAGGAPMISGPPQNAGASGAWLQQTGYVSQPGCSSCGTTAPSFMPQQSYAPQQSYVPQQNYMPQQSCNSCSSNIPMDMYMQSAPMNAYGACDTSCYAAPQACRRGFGVEAQAVFLQRRQPQNQAFAFNPAAPAELLDGRDFNFDVSQGVEGAVTVYDLDCAFDLELRATFLEDWESQVNQNFTGAAVTLASAPALNIVGPRNGAATYESSYFTAELNARYRADAFFNGLTLMTGFRMFRVDEDLNASFVDPAALLPTARIQTETQNRLFGLQLGADQVLFNGPNWFLKVVGRIGVYGNDGDQETTATSLAVAGAVQNARGGEGDVALHGELGVMGKIRITRWANAVGGYRAVFLDGLATASDQLNSSSFFSNQGYNSNSSMLLHGANVGLEIVF